MLVLFLLGLVLATGEFTDLDINMTALASGYWAAWIITLVIGIRSLIRQEDAKIASRPQRAGIPSNVRQAIWNRDGGQCAFCGAATDLEFDHIVPVAKGGSNTENNIQLLCASCNRSKGAKIR